MATCPSCAEPVEEGAERCAQCGDVLRGPVAPAPPAAPLVPPRNNFVLAVFFTVMLMIAAALYVLQGPPRPDPEAEFEAAARNRLLSLHEAQARFRDGDLDGDGLDDFGTLEELVAVGLVDGEVLKVDFDHQYVVQMATGAGPPEPTWQAVLSPAVPGKTGKRSYVITQAGVVHEHDQPQPVGLQGR